MTVKDFVKQFSRNNEIYVENRENYRMTFFFNENDKKGKTKLMDWYLPMSELAECEMIRISQVYDRDGSFNAITFKVDTDKKSFMALKDPDIVKSPLWFVDEVFGTKTRCCEG